MARKTVTFLSSLGVFVGATALACCNGPEAAQTSASGTGGSARQDAGPDPVPFQADSPEVYVAKVKNLLVGKAPTDDEIKAVKADPKALKALIDGWMKLPEYQDKMMVFFELAFQQTQITTADFIDMMPKGLGKGPAMLPLLQNIKESFARTVLALLDEGKPFTEAMTTKRVMMTPPLMEIYAVLDQLHTDDQADKTGDDFGDANKGVKMAYETAEGPIPLAETLDPKSPHYLHWYSPDVAKVTDQKRPYCDGVDPILMPATTINLHTLLYGGVDIYKTAGGQCSGFVSPNGAQFTAEDFKAWKMVTIRPPKGSEATTKFYDLPTLRTSTEIVLKTPHPGFFNTPAFFANWSTNASNQMRVTLNQALIVATGFQVDGSDPTEPSSTPGLDAEHAPPGSPCHSCHQTLDPTRAILSSTYTYSYSHQEDPAQIKQKGLFAFQGVEKPVSSIDDFAEILATHPAMPGAWAQKLCYYANSTACLVDDPEFLRVVKVFQDSGLSWNALVRELLSSPLTTNATATKTTQDNETVAVARRDHLCAALDNRLGLVDVCGLNPALKYGMKNKPSIITTIVGGLPSDGYGRGSTAPVLPNQPSLFYRAGLENICEAISAKVIDAAADPMAPDAVRWKSTEPDAAIADFVHIVMALTPSDARATPAQGLLKSHFTDAVKSGESASDALKSTFVTACLSPSAIGIGM